MTLTHMYRSSALEVFGFDSYNSPTLETTRLQCQMESQYIRSHLPPKLDYLFDDLRSSLVTFCVMPMEMPAAGTIIHNDPRATLICPVGDRGRSPVASTGGNSADRSSSRKERNKIPLEPLQPGAGRLPIRPDDDDRVELPPSLARFAQI